MRIASSVYPNGMTNEQWNTHTSNKENIKDWLKPIYVNNKGTFRYQYFHNFFYNFCGIKK